MRGRSSQATNRPIPAEMALERFGAYTDTATARAAPAKTRRAQPGGGQQHQRAAGHLRQSRPGQRPAARPPASSHTGPGPSPSCPARSPRRTAGSPAASRGSCGRAPRRSTVQPDRKPLPSPISAWMRTIRPKVEWPNQAAPATEVRSQPHRSQNKTQPATSAGTRITAVTRS